MSARARLATSLLAATLLACGPPVTVTRVLPQDVYRRDSASILDSGEPTRFTATALHANAVPDAGDRRGMLLDMHEKAIASGRREGLLALAELAYLQGQQTHERSDYLGAAVYAYLYLFAPLDDAGATAWDPRTRIAADIYNRALARAFSTPDGDEFVLTAGSRRLPIGQLAVSVPASSIEWGDGVTFDTFLPADVYEVSGLAARYRRAGLGAPLIAHRRANPESDDLFPEHLDVPATAFLRVDGGLEELRTGRLRGTLELYDPLRSPTVTVAGHEVPLEAQTTTAYAHLLGDSPMWQFELAGFLSGADETIPPGISLLEPYRPDAIPVILVHGTASSPGRWAGMFNDLSNDPVIHEHFQFWFFAYNSGNPIAYSAARLREAIADTVHRLDPEGDDRVLRNMVLIGHSQGGLLVRLAISDSTQMDWRRVGIRPLDEVELDEEERKAVQEVFLFRPVPGARRAVFIATPHRGSFVAGGFLGRIGASLVSVSKSVLQLPVQALRMPIALATGETAPPAVSTAVDNMAPDSTFNRALRILPMAPDVPKHSIIAVDGDGPVELGNDGVVAYESAHLDDVESEIVVRSRHSVQSNPEAVREIWRILLEHLQVVEAASEPAATADDRTSRRPLGRQGVCAPTVLG